jgi:hypothetical protein
MPCYSHALLQSWVIADGSSRVGSDNAELAGANRRHNRKAGADRFAVASRRAIEPGFREFARLIATRGDHAAEAYECEYDGNIEPQYGINGHDVLIVSSLGRPSLVNRVRPRRLRDRMSQE